MAALVRGGALVCWFFMRNDVFQGGDKPKKTNQRLVLYMGSHMPRGWLGLEALPPSHGPKLYTATPAAPFAVRSEQVSGAVLTPLLLG